MPTLRFEKAGQETFRLRVGPGWQHDRRRARLQHQSKVMLRVRHRSAPSALSPSSNGQKTLGGGTVTNKRTFPVSRFNSSTS